MQDINSMYEYIKKEFLPLVNNNDISIVLENDKIRIKIINGYTYEFLDRFFEYEESLSFEDLSYIWLDVKTEKGLVIKFIEYCLARKSLIDPCVILNILNLIKTYTSYNNEFFNSQENYFSSLVDFLDAKLTLKDKIKEFITDLSICFYSILQSSNKFIIDTEECKDIDNIYLSLFSSMDFYSICGIIGLANDFNTEKCYKVKNAFSIINNIISKNNISDLLLTSFIKEFNNDASS